MMKWLGFVGLIFLAALTLSAASAATASALACVPTLAAKEGNYTAMACLVFKSLENFVEFDKAEPPLGNSTIWCAEALPGQAVLKWKNSDCTGETADTGDFAKVNLNFRLRPRLKTALPGEAYPLNLGGHLKGKSELVTASGGTLVGTEFSILLHVVEETSLGTSVMDFLGVEEEEKHKCHTEGASEANGAVLVPNAEFHLVYTNTPLVAQLEMGALILFSKFTISCDAGLLETSVTGPSTARISVPAPETGKEGDGTSLEIASHCGNRTTALQEITEYYNEHLELTRTTLLANLSGTGNKPACEEIEGTTLLAPETGSSASMFSVLF